MCPEAGWSAHLEPTRGNTGFNPLLLHLDLVLTPPKGGAAKVMTLVVIDEWRQQPPVREYEQVEFHRSDAKPPPIIDVDHPQ